MGCAVSTTAIPVDLLAFPEEAPQTERLSLKEQAAETGPALYPPATAWSGAYHPPGSDAKGGTAPASRA